MKDSGCCICIKNYSYSKFGYLYIIPKRKKYNYIYSGPYGYSIYEIDSGEFITNITIMSEYFRDISELRNEKLDQIIS